MADKTNRVDEMDSAPDLLRSYSKTAVDQLQAAVAEWEEKSPQAASELQEAVGKLLSEASFFGYPTTARLTRKLHDLFGKLPVEPSALTGTEAINWGLETLTELVTNPHNSALNVRIDTLCKALDEIRKKLDETPSTQAAFNFGAVASKSSATAFQKSNDHVDQNIYSSDTFDGMEKCSDEESWIVTQLASAAEELAGRGSDAKPASKLMSVLKGHQFFQHVDRVCVVGLMPHGNQLVVVDSCISKQLREMGSKNRMPSGYSCFVNPEGSLAHMKPGVLRIFADSRTVLDSFAKEGKPAQRSIAYVAESGLRSGICLAVGRGASTQGFVFMNSLQPNFFGNVMRDYAPLLSLVSLLGTVALDAAGFHVVESPQDVDGNASLSKHSEVFRADEFTSFLQGCVAQQTASNCKINLIADEELRFLYIPAVVVTILAEVAARLGFAIVGAENEFDVEVFQKHEQISFRVSSSAGASASRSSVWMESMLSGIARRHSNRPLAFECERESVLLHLPYEPVLPINQRVLYSVAY